MFPSGISTRDLLRRVLSLLTGLLVMLTSGSVYMFSVYSGPLGDQLNYSVSDLTFIVTFGQSVFYLAGVPAGLASDRWGGRITCSLGALVSGISYMLMILTYTGHLKESSYLLFTLYYSLAGIGSSLVYAAALAVNVKIFPETVRGAVVGSHVALYGLSSLVFTQINSRYFISEGYIDVVGFLICLASVMTGVGLMGGVALYDISKLEEVVGEAPLRRLGHLARYSRRTFWRMMERKFL